ncbi:hypothetical protein [Vibrio cionasavignyae]|uniref:hypothetical protein n=1 Tax=Vibrio cionasavignyae TaxID=2910252 RepID=UPI003D12E814
MQQHLGHAPIVNSLVYKRVKYSTIFDAQRAYTQDQNAFYQKKEQEQIALESRGIKAFKNMNDAIRGRLNPTEDGLANPLERPLKPMGEVSNGIFEQFASELAHEPSGRSADIASVQPSSPVNDPCSSEPLLYSQTQTVEKRLSDSLALECSLEEEMAKNMQHVLITDLEDAHKILHNVWLESGKDVAALAASINTANSWFNHTEPMFDAASIARQFGDMNIKADLVESKGKIFVAFNGTDQNGKALKHAFVNGTRINMNGKKYPLNSFKAMQTGFSPKSRAANFKGAAVLTFVVSASIATSDLIFKDDYHLVDWFGNVGADMFKALLQYGAGEAALFVVVAMTGSILIGGIVCALAYLAIELIWSEYEISKSIVTELENAVEN